MTRDEIRQAFFEFSDWAEGGYKTGERPTLKAALIEAAPQDHHPHIFGVRFGVFLVVADGEDYDGPDWTIYDERKGTIQAETNLTYDEALALLLRKSASKAASSPQKRHKSNVVKVEAPRSLTPEEARWVKRMGRVFADRPSSLALQAGGDTLILLDHESFSRDEPSLYQTDEYRLAEIELGTTLYGGDQ